MSLRDSNFLGSEDDPGSSFCSSISMVRTDVAIVGAGVAGLYAAYCCRLANIDCAIIESLANPGGQCIALYPEKRMYGTPGFVDIKAKDFIHNLSEQCLQGVSLRLFGYKVSRISKNSEIGFDLEIRKTCSLDCHVKKDLTIASRYVILTTGIGDMVPNIPSSIIGIDEFSNESSDFVQSYCLNLNLYQGKRVVVAGGGDSAVDFAMDISRVAKRVVIIHRRKYFTCEPSKLLSLNKLVENGKLEIVLENNITELKEDRGKRFVITIDQNDSVNQFETDHIVFCYGFAARLSSISGLDDMGIQMEKNLLKVDFETMETSVKNCYAAGDVVEYPNKKKNIVPCFFEADRAVRSIKGKLSQE